MKKVKLVLSIGFICCSCLVFSNIINIPADQPIIQFGITFAADGDTVLVHPGTHPGTFNFDGKLITIASLFLTTHDTSYISSTIITGNNSSSVITFENGEDSSAVLCGFTITNGGGFTGGGIYCNASNPCLQNLKITDNSASVAGGGIYCYNSSPGITNVTISGNTADHYGGGICCYNNSSPSLDNVTIIGNHSFEQGGGINFRNSNPTLMNVTITGNTSSQDGGGIYLYVSSTSLQNVLITGNSANLDGGGICLNGSDPWLRYVVLTENSANRGAGIFLSSSSPNLENVTITANTASQNGGGIWCQLGSYPSIVNSILWNNSPQEIYGSTATTATYSDIEGGWTGTGNIDSDPLFIDADNGNYHLSWDNFPMQDATMSPCINAGDPASPFDPDSTITDMGAYYFYQYLIADFTADVTIGEIPLMVIFNDLSAQGIEVIEEWYWDFGDGNNSTLQNPSNEYLLPGIYTVSLTVTDVNDSTNTETKVAYINVDPPAYSGTVWHISTSGSDIFGNGSAQYPFATIQHGINISSNTDTVLVDPGTYIENVNFNGKLITVGSLCLTTQDLTYISSTIIDGNSNNSVVIFENGEDTTAILCGFTITNGYSTNGGGIRCTNYSSPNLQYLSISGNSAGTYGGGISLVEYSSPYIENVTIVGNSTSGDWGYGGGVFCYLDSNPILKNVTISNNSATLYGGGIFCQEGSDPSLVNTILWNDSPQEIYLNTASITATYSDIQGGYTGTGNIDSDPLFVNPVNGSDNADYHLLSNSPCIDAGDPTSPIDPDGTIVEMGAYFFNHEYNGRIWHIATTGSDITGTGSEEFPFATIQRGINASSHLDTVLVQPGTYLENAISFNGKFITVASLFLTTIDTAYISSTIIDGNSSGSVFKFESDEDSSSNLTGFTITNGDALFGGGIYCVNSNPSLNNILISGNTAEFGGGIHIANSSPALKNVTISNNSTLGTYGYGGGINCEGSSPGFENVMIIGNSALYGGGINFVNINSDIGKITIAGNTASGNGGGIFFHDSSPNLDRVTIAGNISESEGGGIYCNYNSNPSMVNSILWGDTPQEIYISSGSATITYSDIQGQWIGLGNIDSDPLFENPTNGDYHLQPGSPCIDAGDPASSLDPDGSIADMGAYYTANRLNLKVFLQGPFNGTEMNIDLHAAGLIPTNQPYDISPWNYAGSESVSSIPDNIVDWVLVELRDATNANTATSATTIDQQVAFLRNDGTVVDLDGSDNLQINGSINQQLFVVIRHRNHIDVMSISPLQKSAGVYSYDFTTLGQAIGLNATIHIGNGIYGMYSGDANADGLIDEFDISAVWIYEAGKFDYLPSDLNLDSQSNNIDKNDFWFMNRDNDCQVPE